MIYGTGELETYLSGGYRLAVLTRLGDLIPKLTDQNSFASWVLNVSAVRPGGIGSGQWVLVLGVLVRVLLRSEAVWDGDHHRG